MLKTSNDGRKLLLNFDVLAQAPEGVAKLRELILTLAVQGKLVPQDASDEPASVLLQRIQAEKARLVAEGKIKKEKPLPEITEEEKPFELPVGWEWVRLGNVGYTNIGLTYSPNDVSHQGVPVLRSNNIQNGRLDLTDLKRVSLKIKESAFVCDGDLLICARNGSKALVGKTALIEGLKERMAFGAFMAIFRSEFNKYICKYINSQWFRRVIADVNTTTINQITQDNLKNAVLALPPLAEQSRIVARVESLMQLCDALEAKGQLEASQHQQLLQALLGSLTQSADAAELAHNWQRVAAHFDVLLDRPEAIDALEQTILQLAVRGLLVPQDPADETASELLKKIRAEKDRLIAEGKIKRDKPLPAIGEEEKPFELPVGWEWVRFDELIHPQKPIAYGVLVPGPDVPTGVPFVRIADLSINNPPEKPEKTISHEIDAQFARTRLEGGEILMGVVGSIGKLGIVPKSWNGANIARAICRIVPADDGLREFVLFLLETRFMQENFAGDTRTLAQPTLNIGLIRSALTPMPPAAEQSRIVARVNELRALCQQLREQLTQARHTQSLLAQAWVEQAAA